MSVYYSSDKCVILNGDVLDCLKEIGDGEIQCCITSPPYWGLRDYGVEGQLGLERTPEEYVAKMVAVFAEVRRVLRDDGTLWLNLGDTYHGGGGSNYGSGLSVASEHGQHLTNVRNRIELPGLKPKDLVGIPWSVAFALRADGWVLRQEIIWAKPNPMPESVTDRCTKSHEQIFLFSKAKWTGPERGQFAHISDADARWLALLVDAEGCIVVKRCQHDGRADTFAPQVSIGNTSESLMREVVRIVGRGTMLERPGKNCRMLYWQLANNVARDFLYRIYPFLIVKQRQARIGIYVDSLTYYRGGKMPERKSRTVGENTTLLSLWARGKECNHFGVPDLSDVPEPKYGRWDSQKYYYDAEAVKEPSVYPDDNRKARSSKDQKRMPTESVAGIRPGSCVYATRNRRDVWTVVTKPYKGAHFATFPEKLIEPMILAGTSEKGCCPKCGAPWLRIIEKTRTFESGSGKSGNMPVGKNGQRMQGGGKTLDVRRGPCVHSSTQGWKPSCFCNIGETVPCIVLDPFVGSGTTAAVSARLGRKCVGIELNGKYCALAKKRIQNSGKTLT